jgi:hypothetical protein
MSEPEPQSFAAPKRRWHQYSLRTLLLLPLLLALVLSAVDSWPRVQRRYIVWRLQGYVDKDLRKVPGMERIRVCQRLEQLIAKHAEQPLRDYERRVDDGQYWLLHNADVPGLGRRMLVVELGETIEAKSGMANGRWPCRIDALDSWARATHVVTFDANASPRSVEFDDSRHGFLCMKLETEAVFPWMGKNPMRFYYRILDGQAELIRAENSDGTFYGVKFALIGLPPVAFDAQDLLDSTDHVQQLRGLAAYYYGKPFQLIQFDDNFRHRCLELANSPDPWISEEAKMALDDGKKAKQMKNEGKQK